MKRLTLIVVVCMFAMGAKLPTPNFTASLPLPVPQFEVIHTDQPIVKPTVLTHTRHDRWCMCPEMCYGLHLVNQHGITNAQWNKERLWEGRKMYDLHAKLHKEGVYEKPKPTSGCGPDGCGPGGCPQYGGGLLGRIRQARANRGFR